MAAAILPVLRLNRFDFLGLRIILLLQCGSKISEGQLIYSSTPLSDLFTCGRYTFVASCLTYVRSRFGTHFDQKVDSVRTCIAGCL